MKIFHSTAVAALALLISSPGLAFSDNQDLSRFAPKSNNLPTKIDYTYWDQALEYFVFNMGRSSRQALPHVTPEIGSRIIYGHASRLRLEGNRVIFSFLEQQQIDAISEYRRDLERVGSSLDLTSLSRNEQLAFWMNLHNVAVIEQIALAYPVKQPSRMKIGPSGLPLDQSKFITVDGVALSPRDIRTKIVFPNWSDPRVLYGFFRGDIGSPSIQREAFVASKLGEQLDFAAYEFVNSLRGTEKRGKTLHTSRIYREAFPTLFASDEETLRAHLLKYSSETLKSSIKATKKIRFSIYEFDISDLANADRSREYSYNLSDKNGFGHRFSPQSVVNATGRPHGVPAAVGRLLVERTRSLSRRQRDNVSGEVIVLTPERLAEQDAANREVK